MYRRVVGDRRGTVFGVEAPIGAGMVVRIAPRAFAATLTERANILALVDHDPHRVLARTRSGTLRLSEDARGLAFEIDGPDTSAGRDVLALAERGDLGGMSFGFVARDEHIEGNRRELRAVELSEVSVVAAFPAYDGTEVSARSQAAQDYTADRLLLRILELGL